MNKVLKNPDSTYKLKIAEQYFVKQKFNKAQQIFEDIMPYFKTTKQFEDIYFKYAYCAYNQKDYLNAENLFKTFLEYFPTSIHAEEVDYMRAYCYFKQSPKPELDQTNTIKAIGMMQTFINTHPGSSKINDANKVIDICHAKIETKELKAAQLYYDLGQFKAASVAFTSLLDDFPESLKGDDYKLSAIKSFYKYAQLSIEEKKRERFEQVVTQCNEFYDRFSDSKLKQEVDSYFKFSKNNSK